MKKTTLPFAAVAALALTACIPSINPFYTAKDVVFEPALLGQWTAKDSGDQPERWAFEESAGEDNKVRRYDLTVTDDEGREGYFKATLFRIKDKQFLDLIAERCEFATNQAELVAFSVIPGHLVVHVPQVEPELQLAFFDFEWLSDYLEENPKALPHRREDGVVLTGSTRQLQRFVLKHLKGGELFSDYGEMTKQPQSVEPAEAE
jgi:hypothetical protein